MKRNASDQHPIGSALEVIASTQAELPINNHHGLCFVIDSTGIIKSIDNIYKRTRINPPSSKSFFQYLDPASQEIAKEIIDLVFSGMPTSSFSASAFLADGSLQDLSIIVSPLQYQDRVSSVSVICHEVGMNKALLAKAKPSVVSSTPPPIEHSTCLETENKELRRINRFLDNFVTGAAHDLRSPLVLLKTFPDLIRRFTDEDKKHKALTMMKEATIKMENILNCMMQFVDEQKNEAHCAEALHFAEVFDAVFGRLSFELEGINPTFITNFEAAPKVNYYKAQLHSILYNLVSNAIKYRRKNTPIRIEITTRQEEGFVLLQIKDNGIGMDLAQFGHLLFKPFQRLTTNCEGTGLGLSMIKNNLEFNGGKICVESEENQGSTFKVYLKSF